MSTSNTGRSTPESKSGRQQGSTGGSGNESKGQDGDKLGRHSEKQQDQGSSKQNSPGSARGGTHEQHVKAGEQSHKKS